MKAVKKKSLSFVLYDDGSADFHSFTAADMGERGVRLYVIRWCRFKVWRLTIPYFIIETKIIINNGGLQVEKS